ncbi:MAG TPA: flagellar FliJ family protein [Burkholderiaceae bacterium]|nr:flagellar FliJ family protein [Burkholderiaceae bacterium]
MSDTQTLATLLEQCERDRDLAQAAQQRALTASRAAHAQAEQLVDYRRDYEQRWSEQFRREGSIELLRCYQGFMERLTQAVDQQAGVAQFNEQQLAQAATVLRAAEVRCASVRRLIERRSLELRNADERRDQKQNDELAARIAQATASANGRRHGA